MRYIDAQAMADEAHLTGFHRALLLCCVLIIVFDGYDLAVVGIALPLIMKDMAIAATTAGFMISAATVGMMIGAILLGAVADRIGRRRTIGLSVALFSIFTAAAGLSHDPLTFAALRFLSGLGLGGVMPSVIALMTEFSPRKTRATLVTISLGGFALGGMLAAVVGKSIIEHYGWQSVFLAAGIPLFLVPTLLKRMPESLAFLVRAGQHDRVRTLLAKLVPEFRFEPDDRFATRTPQVVESSDEDPAKARQARSSIAFCAASFMCLSSIYALGTWSTKLLASGGYGLSLALTFVFLLNAGALVGALVSGWIADRLPIKWVCFTLLVLAAGAISLLGLKLPVGILLAAAGIAGIACYGGQNVLYAYAGQFYAPAIRSTRLGLVSGVGRAGAIVAPIAMGSLVSMQLPLVPTFLAMALPLLASAVSVALVDQRRSAYARSAPPDLAPVDGVTAV